MNRSNVLYLGLRVRGVIFFFLLVNFIGHPGATIMAEKAQEHATCCEAELYLHFSNQTRERGKNIFNSWDQPLYEILSPQQGDFSLYLYGYGLMSEVPINNVGNFLAELEESMNLKEGEQRLIKTTADKFTLVIERRGESAIVYNLHRNPTINDTHNRIYDVPRSEWEKMIKITRQEYDELVQSVKNHAVKYLSGNFRCAPFDGIEMTVRTNRKAPLIGDNLTIIIEIKNVSEDIKYLVNSFDVYVGYEGRRIISISVTGRPIGEGLKRKPIALKPGEFHRLLKNITIKDFNATIAVEYSASNNFSYHTNMPAELYLKRIGKHYDLSNCWQGGIKAEASIFVLTKNWANIMKSRNKFEDWIKQKITAGD